MEVLYKLGPRGYRASVNKFKGKLRVHIRKYNQEQNQLYATKDGVALNFEEWLSLTEIMNELNELIDKTIDDEEEETDSEDEEQTEQNQKKF